MMKKTNNNNNNNKNNFLRVIQTFLRGPSIWGNQGS